MDHYTWCPRCWKPVGPKLKDYWPSPGEASIQKQRAQLRTSRNALALARKLGEDTIVQALKAKVTTHLEAVRQHQPLKDRIEGCQKSLQQRQAAMEALSAKIAADTARLEEMRADANELATQMAELEARQAEQIDLEGPEEMSDADMWDTAADPDEPHHPPSHPARPTKPATPAANQEPQREHAIATALTGLTELMQQVLARLPATPPSPQRAPKKPRHTDAAPMDTETEQQATPVLVVDHRGNTHTAASSPNAVITVPSTDTQRTTQQQP